jgi:hypothetical protein
MPKAQADIISTVIIVILALSLTSTALLWGLPLIQKRQDSALVARMNNAFTQDLPSRIVNIANNGGSTSFSLDVNGIWVLNTVENSITFTFFSKVSDKAIGNWSGKDCDPIKGFTGKSGILGTDNSFVVCARADQTGSGYNITYKIGFRQLMSDKQGYIIQLAPPSGGTSSSTSKTIMISRPSGAISQNATLITTKIEILL